MVTSRINAQAADAIALTERALELARGSGSKVSVVGHSLGGGHAQITAHRYNLPGEAFNPYGAAGLGYRVPEGSPAGAAVFTNHVMAGDVVSAASPHYGKIEMYVRPGELQVLRQSEHIHGSIAKFNALAGAAAQLADVARMADSHRMHHFLDVDSKGNPDRSVLDDPTARLRSPEDRQLVQDFRDRVAGARATTTLLSRGVQGLTSDLIDRVRGPEAPGAGIPHPGQEPAAAWIPPHQRADGGWKHAPHTGAGSLAPQPASFTPNTSTLGTQLDQLLQAAGQDDPQGFLRLNSQSAAQPAGVAMREAASEQVDQHEHRAAAERDRQQQHASETATRAQHR